MSGGSATRKAVETKLLECIRSAAGEIVAHHVGDLGEDSLEIYAVVQNGLHRDAWVATAEAIGVSRASPGEKVWTTELRPEWDLPYRFRMPAELLDMLSPAHGWGAGEWREVCRQRLTANVPRSFDEPSVGDLLTVNCTDHDIPLTDGLPLLRCDMVEWDRIHVSVVDPEGRATGDTYELYHGQTRAIGSKRKSNEPDRLELLTRYQKATIEKMKAGTVSLDDGRIDLSIWGHGVLATAEGDVWSPSLLDERGDIEGVGAYEQAHDKGLVFIALTKVDGPTRATMLAGRSPDGSIVVLGNQEAGPEFEEVRRAVELALSRRPLVAGWDYSATAERHEDTEYSASLPALAMN